MQQNFINIWKYLIEKNQNENIELPYIDENLSNCLVLEDTTSQYKTSDFLTLIAGSDKSSKMNSAFRIWIATKLLDQPCINNIIQHIKNADSTITNATDFINKRSEHGRELYRLKYSQIDDSTFKPLKGLKFELSISDLLRIVKIDKVIENKILNNKAITGFVVTVEDVSDLSVHSNSQTSNSYKSVEVILKLELVVDQSKIDKTNINTTDTSETETSEITTTPENNLSSYLEIDTTTILCPVYICTKLSKSGRHVLRKELTPNKVISNNFLGKYVKISDIVQNIKYPNDSSGDVEKILTRILSSVVDGTDISSSDLSNLEKIYNIQTTGEYIKFNPDITFGISDSIKRIIQDNIQLLPPQYHVSFKFDFAEIIGAVCLATCCKKISGISDIYIKFPIYASAPLSDYFISNKQTEQTDEDSFKISAKTGEGAKASMKNVIISIEEFIQSNQNEIDRIIDVISSNTLPKDSVKHSIYAIRELYKIFENKFSVNTMFETFALVGAALILKDSHQIVASNNIAESLYTHLRECLSNNTRANLTTESEDIIRKILTAPEHELSINDVDDMINCAAQLNDYISSIKDKNTYRMQILKTDSVECLRSKLIVLLTRIMFANINISEAFIKTFNRLFAKQIGTFMQVHLNESLIDSMLSNKPTGSIEFLGKAVSANGEKLTADTFEHQFYFSASNPVDKNGKILAVSPKIHLESLHVF